MRSTLATIRIREGNENRVLTEMRVGQVCIRVGVFPDGCVTHTCLADVQLACNAPLGLEGTGLVFYILYIYNRSSYTNQSSSLYFYQIAFV